MNQRVGAMNQRVGAMNQRVGAMNQRVGAMNQRVGAMNQRVGAMNQRVSATFREAARHRESMDLEGNRPGRIEPDQRTTEARRSGSVSAGQETELEEADSQLAQERSSITQASIIFNMDMKKGRGDFQKVLQFLREMVLHKARQVVGSLQVTKHSKWDWRYKRRSCSELTLTLLDKPRTGGAPMPKCSSWCGGIKKRCNWNGRINISATHVT
ncbi:hypothetical protein BKA93DRAFT_748266 [Sparassis latifolia]